MNRFSKHILAAFIGAMTLVGAASFANAGGHGPNRGSHQVMNYNSNHGSNHAMNHGSRYRSEHNRSDKGPCYSSVERRSDMHAAMDRDHERHTPMRFEQRSRR